MEWGWERGRVGKETKVGKENGREGRRVWGSREAEAGRGGGETDGGGQEEGAEGRTAAGRRMRGAGGKGVRAGGWRPGRRRGRGADPSLKSAVSRRDPPRSAGAIGGRFRDSGPARPPARRRPHAAAAAAADASREGVSRRAGWFQAGGPRAGTLFPSTAGDPGACSLPPGTELAPRGKPPLRSRLLLWRPLVRRGSRTAREDVGSGGEAGFPLSRHALTHSWGGGSGGPFRSPAAEPSPAARARRMRRPGCLPDRARSAPAAETRTP